MKKLFALETDSPLDKNQLVIDKVIEYSQKQKNPLNLTATLLKERHELKKDIEEKLELNKDDENKADDLKEETDTDKKDSETDELDMSITDDKEDAEDEDKKEDTEDVKEDEDDKDDDGSIEADDEETLKQSIGKEKKDDKSTDKNVKEEDKKKEIADKQDTEKEEKEEKQALSKEDEEDIGASADNKNNLKSIIGSGTSKVAKESLSAFTPKELFFPLQQRYDLYKLSLESYNIKRHLAFEEQPVVYIKEEVLSCLNTLVQLSNNYISNNIDFIKKSSTAVFSINKELSVYNSFFTNNKHEFNLKLISNKDILTQLSTNKTSNPYDTGKVLLNFSTLISKLSVQLIETPFNNLPNVLKTSNFNLDEISTTDFTYKEMLPGFNTVTLAIVPFVNYVKTNIKDYSTFRTKRLSTETLFELSAIELTKDNELENLLKLSDKLLLNISTFTENLNIVNSNFTSFIDKLKIAIYDVQNDKVEKLSELHINELMKDFVKFKIVIELLYITINSIIEFLTSVLSVLKLTVNINSK